MSTWLITSSTMTYSTKNSCYSKKLFQYSGRSKDKFMSRDSNLLFQQVVCLPVPQRLFYIIYCEKVLPR